MLNSRQPMTLHDIVFDSTGTLRSGYRVGIFILGFIVVGMVLGAAAYGLLVAIGLSPEPGSPYFLAANGVMSLIAALGVGWLCGWTLESLPFSALGASFAGDWLKNLVVGSVVGAAALSLAVLIAWAFGGLTFTVNDVEPKTIAMQLVSIFLIFAAAAAFEEALFRGYILQTFTRSGLAWFAIVLTSAFFGAAHLTNPSATAISTANTMLAGVMFAFAYLRTRDLWFPFGIHLMWNWMQGAFFGIEVSGLNDIAGATLLKEIDRGPIWLTGETYGIEGGIACTIALFVTIAAIWFMPQRSTPYDGAVDAASADGVSVS